MDSGTGITLCQPSLAILLVSIAGVIYHLMAGAGGGIMWWLAVGVVGTATFQALCFGGLEPVAWVLMMIPVLLVCFFLAVALFSSSVRIKNVEKVPCGRCGKKPPCGCDGWSRDGGGGDVPPCDGCPWDDRRHKKHHDRHHNSCNYCGGGGCNMCGGDYLEQA